MLALRTKSENKGSPVMAKDRRGHSLRLLLNAVLLGTGRCRSVIQYQQQQTRRTLLQQYATTVNNSKLLYILGQLGQLSLSSFLGR